MTDDLDVLFRRLSARGYFEITPSSLSVPAGTETDADGHVWEVSKFVPAIRLQWAPRGQGGPGRGPRFNPFCSRSWAGRSLAEVLRRAVEDTAPPWRPLGEAPPEPWRRVTRPGGNEAA